MKPSRRIHLLLLLLCGCDPLDEGARSDLGEHYLAGDKKRGQVYYEMVCTECHRRVSGTVVSPSERTRLEWRRYLDADRHPLPDVPERKLSHYVSRAYRQSIAADNIAAAVFIDLDADVLYTDLGQFMILGASDSSTPHSCTQ